MASFASAIAEEQIGLSANVANPQSGWSSRAQLFMRRNDSVESQILLFASGARSADS